MKLSELRKRFKKTPDNGMVTIELPEIQQVTFTTASGCSVVAVPGNMDKPDQWHVAVYEDIRSMTMDALEDWMLDALRKLPLPYSVFTVIALDDYEPHDITFQITVGHEGDLRSWTVADFTVRATSEHAAFTVPAPEVSHVTAPWGSGRKA